MELSEYINVTTFCKHHTVSEELIFSLCQFDLLEITTINETKYFQEIELESVEKFLRLHRDLQIQSDSMDVIAYLLQKNSDLQNQNMNLKQRLDFYES